MANGNRKKFNITHLQRNVDQYSNEMSHALGQNGCYQVLGGGAIASASPSDSRTSVFISESLITKI